MRLAIYSLSLSMIIASQTYAAPITPKNEWHLCQSDDDCMLAKAPCGPFAVNKNYQQVAEQYHARNDDKAHCKSGAMYPKPNAARCSFESCSAVYN